MKYTKTKYQGIFSYKTSNGQTRYRVRLTFNAGLKEHSKSGFKTLAEARVYQADAETKLATGLISNVVKSKITLSQHWEAYRTHKIESGKWGKATQANSINKIQPFLDQFGHIPMADISRANLQKYVNQLYDERGYSEETMRSYFKMFMQVIDDAVDEDILPKNYFRKVSYLRQDGWSPKQKTISIEQFKEFMSLAKENMRKDVFRCLYILSFGLRRSEVYAVRESSITFLGSGLSKIEINMARTVQHPEGTSTKSRASNRFIIVDETGTAYLKEQIEFAKMIRKTNNQVHHADDFIFICPHRCVPYPDKTLNDHIDKIVPLMEQPVKLSPHMFRHMFSTYASASGVDVLQLQKFLGHSSAQMTNHYTKESEIGATNIVQLTANYRDF